MQEESPMPKRSLPLILALSVALTAALTGCDSLTGGDQSRPTVNRTYRLADAASSQGGAAPAEENLPAVRTTPVLYHPDATGKYIVCRELPALSIRDQALDVKLVDALVDAGVLQSGTTLQSLSFDLSQEDKATELVLLDFNKRFQNQVKACATPEEERLLVGSVVNTFLAAYDREAALLTVNGKQLRSQFEEYSYGNPVAWYPASVTQPYTAKEKVDGVRLKVELTQMYSEAGFLLDQDTETFHYRYDYATNTASYHAQDTRQRAQTPAYLSITPTDLSEPAALAQLRQELGGKGKESTEKIGRNGISATYLSRMDGEVGMGRYYFQADGKGWMVRLHWNAGEEETRLPRMKLMLSTFHAVS